MTFHPNNAARNLVTVTGDGFVLVGFKEAEWAEKLK